MSFGKITSDIFIANFKYLIDKIDSFEMNDSYQTIEYAEMINSNKRSSITKSDTTMENAYDVSLKDVDYTIGKALEYIMFDKYYDKEKILTFCRFVDFQSGNLLGVLRIAFSEKKSVDDVKECLRISCAEIIDIFEKLKQLLITKSHATMENAYDISLTDVDYSVGKALEHIMFDKYYEKEQIFTFCRFVKSHPHNLQGVLRIAFSEKKSVDDVKEYLKVSCAEIIDIFEKIKQLF